MPIVVSVTISAERTMKHIHETTKGFTVIKPSMMLDISMKQAVFIFKEKIFLP